MSTFRKYCVEKKVTEERWERAKKSTTAARKQGHEPNCPLMASALSFDDTFPRTAFLSLSLSLHRVPAAVGMLFFSHSFFFVVGEISNLIVSGWGSGKERAGDQLT